MLALWAICPVMAQAFDPGRATFSVLVGELVIPYRVFAIYVLPEETIDVGIAARSTPGEPTLKADTGRIVSAESAHWRWQAPGRPGPASIEVGSGDERILLNVIVMHPASSVSSGRINGYRLGDYPAEPLDGNPIYDPPDGFIELNESNAALQLSPHFRLSQFPSKQSQDFSKYLVLREQLLLKLELLLERLNERGIEADTLTIMSGYRTPFYNAAIGNVPYSRHVYGGAVDIYVDVAPHDDYMDDLNRDGKLDYHDAQWLYRLAQELFDEESQHSLQGGLGVYAKTSAHGPFVHMDARAKIARWGLLP